MANKVLTHLMFNGTAEEAMQFYVSLLPDSQVTTSEYFTEGEHEGKLQLGRFELGGREFICINTLVEHDFDFTPSMSIFVEFESKAELERCYAQLSEGGNVLMPLGDYGFSPLFGWVADRFGVSWQLNMMV